MDTYHATAPHSTHSRNPRSKSELVCLRMILVEDSTERAAPLVIPCLLMAGFCNCRNWNTFGLWNTFGTAFTVISALGVVSPSAAMLESGLLTQRNKKPYRFVSHPAAVISKLLLHYCLGLSGTRRTNRQYSVHSRGHGLGSKVTKVTGVQKVF